MNFRKSLKYVISAIVILATASSYGQTHYSSNVAIGAKGGIDFTRVFFNPGVRQTMAMGSTAAVMVRYIEENHFGLIGELGFTQRGWQENFEGAPYRYHRTLNYVNLPILAHIYFGRRGKFFFNAGPEFSLFLSDKTDANFDPADMARLPDFPYINRQNQQMLLDVSQKFDYGISAGLGAEFNLNKRNSVSVEGRVYFGLGNILPSKRADTFSASNQMTVSATLGYWFRVK